MNQMYDALRDLHPGYEVADIRLLANAAELNGRHGEEMDAEFAEAVRKSETFSLES